MIRIGTSGWSYKHWKGIFYPEKIPQKKWLEYFSQHFNTVEVNSSFYHIPRESVTGNWATRTPENFKFSLKMSRLVSHVHKLKNCYETLEWFFKNTSPLAEKISTYLIQLPPSFCPGSSALADFIRLLKETASKQLPNNLRVRFTFEFRNPDCYNSATIDILKADSVALCFHDYEKAYAWSINALGLLDKFITSDFIYIRFHGYGIRYGGSYPDDTLKGLARRLQEWDRTGLDVFAYFNNDAQGFAVQNAFSLKNFIKT